MNVSEFIAKVAPHIGSGNRHRSAHAASHAHAAPTTTGGKIAVGAEKLGALASGVGLMRTAVAQRGWKRWGLLVVGGILLYRILAPRQEERR